MVSLFAAAIFFVGIHPVISGSPLRGKIVALIGEGPFPGLFSLLSLVGLVRLVRAYSHSEYIQLLGKALRVSGVRSGCDAARLFVCCARVHIPKPNGRWR